MEIFVKPNCAIVQVSYFDHVLWSSILTMHQNGLAISHDGLVCRSCLLRNMLKTKCIRLSMLLACLAVRGDCSYRLQSDAKVQNGVTWALQNNNVGLDCIQPAYIVSQQVLWLPSTLQHVVLLGMPWEKMW